MNDKPDDAQLQAFTDAFHEPDQARPTPPPGRIPYNGVIIASRFNLEFEFEQMRRAIDAMPDITVLCLESIWCDSKEGHSYSVGVKPHCSRQLNN